MTTIPRGATALDQASRPAAPEPGSGALAPSSAAGLSRLAPTSATRDAADRITGRRAR